MPSVDDVLHHAFQAQDDEWTRRAPAARDEVLSRHRRHQVLRRSIAGSLVAASLVVALSLADGDPGTRVVEPAEPIPTSTAPAGATPLEGTWISEPLGKDEVYRAARRADAAKAATAMVEVLPEGPFRVVMVVRGSSLSTSVRSRGAEDMLLDQEALSITGQQLELRPFDIPAATFHQWAVDGEVLTMSFGSTSEGWKDGVPGEAWHRLLYDSAPLARQDVQ